MGMRVKVDLSKLHKMYNRSNLIKARKAALNDAHQAMEKYVPYDGGGDLRKESFINSDGTEIIYTMPYAKAQFYGVINNKYPVRHYTTPGTGKRWDLRLKNNKQDMKKVKEAFINGANWHK